MLGLGERGSDSVGGFSKKTSRQTQVCDFQTFQNRDFQSFPTKFLKDYAVKLEAGSDGSQLEGMVHQGREDMMGDDDVGPSEEATITSR